ncbi:polygalacturonase-like [Prosopis cineraria]|uniref:polygalacturonase-like n=1 Tax=Prosopis cineraria TaxID=364024 RepID=UPI00240F262D|nr:polygalacturonase-like [Prosopis cineraria]
MAITTNSNPFIFLIFFSFLLLFQSSSALDINVESFGAEPNGMADSTTPFLKAWSRACESEEETTIYVPQGSFLVKQVTFHGPCKKKVKFRIDGTIVAPGDSWSLGNSGYWILFRKLDGLSIYGVGTIDARGSSYWACRKARNNCPPGARSISFSWSSNVVVSGIKSVNSQTMHMAIDHCKNVIIEKVKIRAPSRSPNTDGINVQFSTGVTISNAIIATGDDCISISQGSAHLWIDHITCGPGHGISIGSLGNYEKEEGVENVTVTGSTFTKTDNGVRIKSKAQPSNGFTRDMVFRNLIMHSVFNPIIIDQRYCPGAPCHHHQNSGVKISRVRYEEIRGTSRSEVAINLDCSASNPCEEITLRDIKLTYAHGTATSSCRNAAGTSRGYVIPKSCL